MLIIPNLIVYAHNPKQAFPHSTFKQHQLFCWCRSIRNKGEGMRKAGIL